MGKINVLERTHLFANEPMATVAAVNGRRLTWIREGGQEEMQKLIASVCEQMSYEPTS